MGNGKRKTANVKATQGGIEVPMWGCSITTPDDSRLVAKYVRVESKSMILKILAKAATVGTLSHTSTYQPVVRDAPIPRGGGGVDSDDSKPKGSVMVQE